MSSIYNLGIYNIRSVPANQHGLILTGQAVSVHNCSPHFSKVFFHPFFDPLGSIINPNGSCLLDNFHDGTLKEQDTVVHSRRLDN